MLQGNNKNIKVSSNSFINTFYCVFCEEQDKFTRKVDKRQIIWIAVHIKPKPEQVCSQSVKSEVFLWFRLCQSIKQQSYCVLDAEQHAYHFALERFWAFLEIYKLFKQCCFRFSICAASNEMEIGLWIGFVRRQSRHSAPFIIL